MILSIRSGTIAAFILIAATAASVLAAADSVTVTLAQTPAAVQRTIQANIGDGTLEEIDQTTGVTGASYDVDYTAKNGTEGGFTVTDTGALDSVEITLDQAPAAVQKTIRTDAAGCELESIDKDSDGTFDVDILRAGKEQSFNVADDGTIESMSVEFQDTPSAVQTAIESQLAGWQVSEIDKSLDEFPATYDIQLARGGQEKGITIASDGTLVSMEIPVTSATAPAQATINRIAGAGRVTSIEQNIDPDGVTFDVEAVSPGGGLLSFSVGPGGEEQSEEVSLAGVPGPARATITQTLGQGRIIRIDRSLVEKTGKVLPYEVTAQKDGKPFDFSVGPKGKFLGMDE
jgi:Tfp pilus assembly protein PilV